jgi:hypothetical protein
MLKRWKHKRLLDKQTKIGEKIRRLEQISNRSETIHTLLAKYRKGNSEVAITARENKILSDKYIRELNAESKLIEMRLKPYQT